MWLKGEVLGTTKGEGCCFTSPCGPSFSSFARYGYSTLKEVVQAPPTAELRPSEGKEGEEGEHTQLDEVIPALCCYTLRWFPTYCAAGRHGNELQRIERLWHFTKDKEMWSADYVPKAGA